jgi:PAS domain S-box-containing protein
MSDRATLPSAIPGDTLPSDASRHVDVVDLVEESVAVFGLDMRVTAWNAEAERLYGWKREDVIGGVIQAAVRCSPSEPLMAILEKINQVGTWRGEFVRRTKSGATVVVKAKWSLRRDLAGGPIDIVETSRDITDVRRTEEALERVQYQYQSLFKSSVASFFELDFSEAAQSVRELSDSGVVDLRAFLQNNSGYVRGLLEMIRTTGCNDQSFLTFGNGDRETLLRSFGRLWPDESLGVFAESLVAVFEKKDHYSSEVVLLSLAGQRYDTLYAVSYPPQLLELTRVLVGIVDVTQTKRATTARERSERRYRDLFHFLPVALLQLEGQEVVEIFDEARSQGVTDFSDHLKTHPGLLDRVLNGLKIVEVNDRTVTMLRAQSADEFKGSVERYWTESRDMFREAAAARYSGKPGYEALVKMPAHDGTILDALFFSVFSPIPGEQNLSLVGLIDVSDRVRAQDMLARVQAEIAHAARVSVLGELTASIAHEVSQPLTAIGTNTEASLLWLEHSPPNIGEVRELAARTATEVQRAADIIDRVRLMASRTVPEQRSVGVNLIVEEAVLFLRHELQRNDVAVSLDLASELPQILGDRVQLQQVVVNLAINGIQAMAHDNSPARILTVRTAATLDGGILLEVEDTGPGIDVSDAGRLFESFFTTKATGMGIGLPICRTIIEAHGGQISAGSRTNGSGARFTIRLPAVMEKPSPCVAVGRTVGCRTYKQC